MNDKHVWPLGLQRIMKASQRSRQIRSFKIPKINFSAADYVDRILCRTCEVSEPLMMFGISDRNLHLMIEGDLVPLLEQHFHATPRQLNVV